MATDKKSEGVEVQVIQLEDDIIELNISDFCSNVCGYFNKREWEKFKVVVNAFDLDWRTSRILDVEGTELDVSIDMQGNDAATLHLNDQKIMSMIGFSTSEWEQFKNTINAFKFDE